VVLSRDQAAAVIAVRLFGSPFPELFDLKAPERETAAKEGFDPRQMGRYGCASHAVEIGHNGRAIQAAGYRCGAQGDWCLETRATLRSAGNVWFAQPATELVPYVQFLSDASAGSLLWNGRCVFYRQAGIS
jgi:hypothetical protein